MKRYEGLFILETAGTEENLPELIDSISQEITSLGGNVETVQKMDKRDFSRVADKRHSVGFYVNVIFECDPSEIVQLQKKFDGNDRIFRVLFTKTKAPTVAEESA
jgi:ribosomal protein S6